MAAILSRAFSFRPPCPIRWASVIRKSRGGGRASSGAMSLRWISPASSRMIDPLLAGGSRSGSRSAGSSPLLRRQFPRRLISSSSSPTPARTAGRPPSPAPRTPPDPGDSASPDPAPSAGNSPASASGSLSPSAVLSVIGNLRFLRRRLYGIVRKQGKLVEMHPYRHTFGFVSVKSRHRLLPPASLDTRPVLPRRHHYNPASYVLTICAQRLYIIQPSPQPLNISLTWFLRPRRSRRSGSRRRCAPSRPSGRLGHAVTIPSARKKRVRQDWDAQCGPAPIFPEFIIISSSS